MMCPNLKNPQVAQEFNELVQAVGEKAAYDIWNQNNGYGIESAPNGAPSKLFSDLLSEFDGNRELTIKAKAKVFSKEFKTWFGDWVNNKPISGNSKESENFEIIDLSNDDPHLKTVPQQIGVKRTKIVGLLLLLPFYLLEFFDIQHK